MDGGTAGAGRRRRAEARFLGFGLCKEEDEAGEDMRQNGL